MLCHRLFAGASPPPWPRHANQCPIPHCGITMTTSGAFHENLPLSLFSTPPLIMSMVVFGLSITLGCVRALAGGVMSFGNSLITLTGTFYRACVGTSGGIGRVLVRTSSCGRHRLIIYVEYKVYQGLHAPQEHYFHYAFAPLSATMFAS